MNTPHLLFAALLAATASPAFAARCEPPPQHSEVRREPVFNCPASPQIALHILHSETQS